MTGSVHERTASATFPPEPRAVRSARTFVSEQLSDFGRTTLVDTAALAVTELATNVVLHARTDFTVSVDELDPGPVRVSVRDGSPSVPQVATPGPVSALGRGLRLIAELTDAWGVDRLAVDDPGGPGKSVWFEVGSGDDRDGGCHMPASYDASVTDLLSVPTAPTGSLVEVQLLCLPLQLFAREMTRHRELMREMALIAFGEDGETQHVPAALTRLAAEIEDYRGVGAATDAVRDAAIARGDAVIDLAYRLPPAVAPACKRLNELMDAAEEYCKSENLLTLAGSADGLALRRWYLGEISGQIDGAAPTP